MQDDFQYIFGFQLKDILEHRSLDVVGTVVSGKLDRLEQKWIQLEWMSANRVQDHWFPANELVHYE